MNTLGGTDCGTRRMAFITTSSSSKAQRTDAAARALAGRHDSVASRWKCSTRRRSIGCPASRQTDAVVPRESAGSRAAHFRVEHAIAKTASNCRLLAIPSTGAARPRAAVRARRNGVSLHRSASAHFREPTRTIRTISASTRASTAFDTNRRNRDSDMFGGNSNWRGPIWFPVNYLLIEALERYHHFYGDTVQVEFPTGSGRS